MVRIGGAFPFGQPAEQASLPSGGVYYIPPGNWLIVSMGTNTVLQAWSDMNKLWRTIPGFRGYLSSDGYNYRLLNTTGIAQSPTITNAGSGATNGIGTAATGVTLTVSAPGSNGRLATAYPIVGGSINTTITITDPGSGLVVPPLIVFSPPPLGGIRAKAVCTISGGAINTVTVTDAGAGYTSAPSVAVIPQMGAYAGSSIPSPGQTGLTGGSLPYSTFPGVLGKTSIPGPWTTLPVLTVNPTLTGSGTLTGVVMNDNGSLYSGTPTMSVTGAGAAAVTLAAAIAAANESFDIQPAVQ